MISSITEWWEGVEWESIVMWASILFVVLHRPWRRHVQYVEDEGWEGVASRKESTWTPKVSKHPLLEIDREIHETEMLEEMWRRK